MILEATNLRYQFKSQRVLLFPNLKISPGERILLMGSSGSGKSTLLNLLSGILPLQSGSISIAGQNFSGSSEKTLDEIRADHIGIIFQSLNLIPYLSGYQNAQLAMQFSTVRRSKTHNVKKEVIDIAKRLGLTKFDMQQAVDELSIGQQQRVAAVRALLGQPELILADEPTSALDPSATELFLEELAGEVDATSQAVLMVSHNPMLKPFFTRVVTIEDQTCFD